MNYDKFLDRMAAATVAGAAIYFTIHFLIYIT